MKNNKNEAATELQPKQAGVAQPEAGREGVEVQKGVLEKRYNKSNYRIKVNENLLNDETRNNGSLFKHDKWLNIFSYIAERQKSGEVYIKKITKNTSDSLFNENNEFSHYAIVAYERTKKYVNKVPSKFNDLINDNFVFNKDGIGENKTDC